ncbi:MAG: bifunctional pyr operon transcriptional regulator/uracil phosphoribosyltransferase PyrR [Candidatus Izemoplasmatales bacterium]|jgi:pyrimidine operon attenuation protein/uracil phosphoribosyltransferase
MMKTIIDQNTIERTIRRISYEIIEKNHDLDNVVILGIPTRGVVLGQRIAANIKAIEGVEVICDVLNVRPYRDDLNKPLPKILPNINVTGKTVIFADDVLYTGRTVRAALDAVMDMGRPAKIYLAVLIDRGHRELPIMANYVGKNIPTSQNESILVQFVETDGIEQVVLE